jgi:hypothetical protein
MAQELDIEELFHKITQPWLTRPDWEGTLRLMDLVNESPDRLFVFSSYIHHQACCVATLDPSTFERFRR